MLGKNTLDVAENMDKLTVSMSILETEFRKYFRNPSSCKEQPEDILRHIALIRNLTNDMADQIEGQLRPGQNMAKSMSMCTEPTRTVQDNANRTAIETFVFRSRKFKFSIIAEFDFLNCKARAIKGSEFKAELPDALIRNTKRLEEIEKVYESIKSVSELDICGTCGDDFSAAECDAIKACLEYGYTPAIKLKRSFTTQKGGTLSIDNKPLTGYQTLRVQQDTEWFDLFDFLAVATGSNNAYYKDWRSIVDNEILRNRLIDHRLMGVKRRKTNRLVGM